MSEAPSDATRAPAFEGWSEASLATAWGVPAVEVWARLTSTNDRAAELAKGGTPRGTVVLADEQTEGRGRRGSAWRSAKGAGVWMTIVLNEEDATRQLPLVAGVACAEAVESVCGGIHVGVKWPNDLVVEDRKLGGVLSERVEERVVVGIGVNVRAPESGFPSALAGLATTLEAQCAVPPARDELAGAIVRRLLQRLDAPDPVGAAVAALEARDALRGSRVETEQAGVGTAVGIDASGALWLERADGTRVSVVAGSVRLADRSG